MHYRLLCILGFLYVGGSLFAAADYSMVPKKRSVTQQQALYRIEEGIHPFIAEAMAELNRVAKPIQQELSTKYQTPEKLLTFLQNQQELASCAKKFGVDVAYINNVGRFLYVQAMFKVPSNDASRFRKFIFCSKKGNIHALANLLRIQSIFAHQVDTFRRYCLIVETMVGKFPEGVYHFIAPLEYADDLLLEAKEHSINPHFYFLHSEKEKASFLRTKPILECVDLSLEQKLEAIEKLMKPGSHELEQLGNALALVQYYEQVFRLTRTTFMLMLEGIVGLYSLGQEDLGSDLLSRHFHQLLKKLPLSLPAITESYDIFRELLSKRVISSLVLLFRDRTQGQLAYDLQPLCETLEDVVLEFHEVVEDDVQKSDLWYNIKSYMNNFFVESLQRRKRLLERMNGVFAGYEQRKNLYEQCYQNIVVNLIKDSSQSDQDYLLACSLFESYEEWGTLPNSIAFEQERLPYFSALTGECDKDFMRNTVVQQSMKSSPKLKKKNGTKKKQKAHCKNGKSKPASKVAFVNAKDLAISDDAPVVTRCPSPTCGYCERITKWFNPEKVSDRSKDDILYHSFPLLADIWLIKYGKQSVWHGSQGDDKVNSLPGKIIYPDRAPQFVRFTCTRNKQNRCYHRGIIYSNWDAIQHAEFRPEEIAEIQKECAENGEFSVPKEQMKNYSRLGQIVEQTEEHVVIQDLYNRTYA